MTEPLFGKHGRFRTILADPPWNERGGGGRGAQSHYDVASTKEILRIMRTAPVWDPMPDTHLYMWVTNTFLIEGLWLMERLGFEYKSNLVWIKDSFGLGGYFRGQHELCLFGVMGDGYSPEVKTEAKNISSVIQRNWFWGKKGRRVHSRKPERMHEKVEERSKGPYLEMFARNTGRPGWTYWGNEVGDE